MSPSPKSGMRQPDGLEQRDLDGLFVGYPLDNLLDSTIELNSPSGRQPGIKLPSRHGPGTGNIVVCGPPGVGKSTLGLQLAVACARGEENCAVSAFISLESTIDEIKAKARDYGWVPSAENGAGEGAVEGNSRRYLLEADHLGEVDEFFTPGEHAANLLALLTRPPDCPVAGPQTAARVGSGLISCNRAHDSLVAPAVLLSTLTPRDIVGTGEGAEAVFWRRYRQLECLLMAADELERSRNRDPAAAVSHLAQAAVRLGRHFLTGREPTPPELGAVMRAVAYARGALEVPGSRPMPAGPGQGTVAEMLRLTLGGLAARPLPRPSPKKWALPPEEREEWLRMADQVEQLCSSAEATEFAGVGVEDGRDPLRRRLEKMAAKVMEFPEARAILPLVVVDSLNMFGEAPLSRDQVYQLFQLFKRYRRIGVFTVETGDMRFDSTIADVVIRLSAAQDNGYAVRHLEIEKSRYSSNVRGLHPFKYTKYRKDDFTPPLPQRNPPRRPEAKEPGRCGIVVFPSLHHVVLKTDSTRSPYTDADGRLASRSFNDCFGIYGFESVLPDGILRGQVFSTRSGQDAAGGRYVRGNVVMIRGGRDTFKTSIALNFLADGLAKKEAADRESVMLVRLSDVPLIEVQEEVSAPTDRAQDGSEQRGPARKPRAWPLVSTKMAGQGFDWRTLRLQTDQGIWQNIAPPGKVLIRKLVAADADPRDLDCAAFFELDFKGGNVLPEELVQFVCDILIRRDKGDVGSGPAKIRRVVLTDVAQIGVSYPFLRNSLTSGDLFLPAFVHLMLNFGVDLVMVGTASDVPDADAAVNRAATLANALISCRSVDVFGKSRVVLSADIARRADDELVLPVVRRAAPPPSEQSGAKAGTQEEDEVGCFELDKEYLEGLVGLEGPDPHRPGLVLHVYEEDSRPQERYNDYLETMLRAGLVRPLRPGSEPTRPPRPGPELRRGSEGARSQRRTSDLRGEAVAQGGSEAWDVSVERFDSRQSEAIHDSLDLLSCRPVNRTVVCTVDEFASKTSEAERLFMGMKGDESRYTSLKGATPGPDGRIHVWPYYRNVLLMAYSEEWFRGLRGTEAIPDEDVDGGRWRPTSWGSVRNAVLGSEGAPNAPFERAEPDALGETLLPRKLFWHDQTARETLACMLMDALVAASVRKCKSDGQGVPPRLEELLLPDEPRDLNDYETDELAALGQLLGEGSKNAAELKLRRGERIRLPPDTNVYVCWYSHLRELLDEYPRLGLDLRVCALPGRGFRGDWYLGVLKGSVSSELGLEVIDKLCRVDEEYKRFADGVGLPVSMEFAKTQPDYLAWPLARDRSSGEATVRVLDVFDIHERASSRSEIGAYRKIRSTLAITAEHLSRIGLFVPDAQAGDDKSKTDVRSIVQKVVGGRLFEQLKMLSSGQPGQAAGAGDSSVGPDG